MYYMTIVCHKYYLILPSAKIIILQKYSVFSVSQGFSSLFSFLKDIRWWSARGGLRKAEGVGAFCINNVDRPASRLI